MLRIFKAASSETSLLDDFLLYEDRQRILVEEKPRISGRRQNAAQFLPPPPSPPPPSKKADSVVAEKETIAATWEPSAAAATAAESAEKEASSTTGEPQPARDENGSPGPNSEDSRPSKAAQNLPNKAANLVILGHRKDQFDDDVNSIMKIGSLLIDSKAGEDGPSLSSQNDVITVGSMHIKVGIAANGL